MTKKTRRIRVEDGSGNVFRDLGFPHAERERLMQFLTALGQDVHITVRSTRKTHGALSVSVR